MKKSLLVLLFFGSLSLVMAQDFGQAADELLTQVGYQLKIEQYEKAIAFYDRAAESSSNNQIIIQKIKMCKSIKLGLVALYEDKQYDAAFIHFRPYKESNKDAAYYCGLLFLVRDGVFYNLDSANYYFKIAKKLKDDDAIFLQQIVQKNSSKIQEQQKINDENLQALIKANETLQHKVDSLYLQIEKYITEVEKVQNEASTKIDIYSLDTIFFYYDKNDERELVKTFHIQLENYKGNVWFKVPEFNPIEISVNAKPYAKIQSHYIKSTSKESIDLNILLKVGKEILPNEIYTVIMVIDEKRIRTFFVKVIGVNIKSKEHDGIGRFGLSTNYYPSRMMAYLPDKGNSGFAGNGFDYHYKLSYFYQIGAYVGFQHNTMAKIKDNTNNTITANQLQFGINLMPTRRLYIFGGINYHTFIGQNSIDKIEIKNEEIVISTLSDARSRTEAQTFSAGFGLIYPIAQVDVAYNFSLGLVNFSFGINIPHKFYKFKTFQKEYKKSIYWKED